MNDAFILRSIRSFVVRDATRLKSRDRPQDEGTDASRRIEGVTLFKSESRSGMKYFLGVMSSLFFFPGAAYANPNGAPWGSADPQAAQNCSSCHFDGDAVMESNSITFAGGERGFKAGESYSLVLIFDKTSYAKVGFLVSASSGSFSNPRKWPIDIKDAQARSNSPQDTSDGRALWDIEWHAPATLDDIDEIIFYLAVNAANDDASPFGDEIHFRTVKKLVTCKDYQPAPPGEGRDPE